MTVYFDNPMDGSQGLAGMVSVETMGAGRFGVWPNPPDAYPGRVEFSPAPDGTTALHCIVTADDPLTYSGQRSEVAGNEANLFGQSQWMMPLLYKWDMWVPSSWPKDGNPYTVMQIHDNPDAGSGGWPNVELMIAGSKIFAKIPANFYAYATGSGAAIDMMSAPVQFDKWVTCCLFCKWDKTTDTGFIEFVYDGKVVDGRYNIRSARADLLPPYSKFGMYDCLKFHGFTFLQAWYKNISLRDGKDGYIAATGRMPNPITGVSLLDF